MRRPKLVAFIGVMMVAIAGCASEETPPVAQSPASPTPTVSPQPSPTAKPTPAQPLVTQKSSAPTVSGLIQPTNSQERARQVQTEIKNQSRNPFAGLQPNIPVTSAAPTSVPSVAKLPTTQPATQPAGQPRTQPGRGTSTRSPNQPAGRPSPNRGTTTAQGRNPGGSAIQPKVAVASPSIPKVQGAPLGFNLPPVVPKSQTAALPPKPSTDTAKAVEVTGVITIGRTPQAIVVAPGDASSRYVGVGQRISNGKVLVKRIEMRDGSEPIVILEENGVEVARAVGEKPPQATKPAG